jgi:serine/threonine protein kinase
MSMPVDSGQALLDLFRRSELFDAAQYDRRFSPTQKLPADPRECAAALVQAGLLTPFQAAQLLQGKHRGLVLGSYKILQPIGKGGMGTVFLAEHTAMRRRVALKVIPIDKAQAKLAVELFRREARSAAALDHPNIVRLFDIGEHARVHYLAMEFVDGETLDELLAKESPLPIFQAVAFVSQAAAGLQHAHEMGLVHRDIKPSNLILAKDGTVKLLDMGLARSCRDEADNLTGMLGDSSAAVGTVDYVSPEQSINAAVDARSDIYSLGATLYTLIAGRPPFQGTTLQKLAQLQTTKPATLTSLRPEVPEGLSRVVAKMMARKPSARYQSADEVVAALAPWLPGGRRANTADVARPETPPPAAPLSRRKLRRDEKPARAVILDEPRPGAAWPLVAVICGGVVLFALCLGGIGLLFFRRSPPPGDAAPSSPKPPEVTATAPTAPAPPPTAENVVDPRFTPLPLDKFGTATTRRPLFADGGARATIAFPRRFFHWVGDVPFQIAEARSEQDRNIILLNSTDGGQARTAPPSATLPINAPVTAFHFLGGVGGRAWPSRSRDGADLKGKVAMKLRVRYADGSEEEHAWRNGEEVAAWDERVDVPRSAFAFLAESKHQVRYLALRPRKPGRMVKELVLEKGEVPELANLVFALTVERPKVHYRLDFASLRPHSFECGLDGKAPSRGGEGALPPGWTYGHTASGGCRSSFSCEEIDGRPVLSFRKLEGWAAPRLHSMSFGTLDAGRRYLLRVEHWGEANFTGQFQVRRKLEDTENIRHQVELGPTAGKWRLTELEIVPAAKHPTILVLQSTGRLTERNNFRVRLLEIVCLDAN